MLKQTNGYDEYTAGCNKDIDKIIQTGKDRCLIIVSSRPGDFLHPLKKYINDEVRITGFSEENIAICAELYLNSNPELRRDFLSQANKAGINELLHIPIILLMSCALFTEKKCLPSKKTTLFKDVVLMSISRTTLKTMGKEASEVDDLHELMVRLGKLAWTALNRQSKQLVLYKVTYNISKQPTLP